MNKADATFECRFPGHAGTILLHLYDPDINFESDEFEKEILSHCLTLVGPRAKVYWLQNESPEALQFAKGRAYNPMVYKVSMFEVNCG
jgi:hypothetical protein